MKKESIARFVVATALLLGWSISHAQDPAPAESNGDNEKAYQNCKAMEGTPTGDAMSNGKTCEEIFGKQAEVQQ